MSRASTASVGRINKTIPGVPPVWTPYLATDDLDATFALATEHGGRVIMPVHDAPGLGRVAIVELLDTEGARLRLIGPG